MAGEHPHDHGSDNSSVDHDSRNNDCTSFTPRQPPRQLPFRPLRPPPLPCPQQRLPRRIAFVSVDGGEGRACRGAHAGDNDASYFTTVSGGVDSLDECKAHCLSTVGCHGIENIGRRCEIWTHPIEASISLTGYVCLRLQGGPVTTTPPPTRPVHSSCGQLHDQCGGDMYTGSSCCVTGLRCEYKDSKYSQCVMDDSSTQTCAQIWQQCGGAGWTGSECCVEGLTCVWGNEHYSQCLRLPGSLIEGNCSEGIGRKAVAPSQVKACCCSGVTAMAGATPHRHRQSQRK